MSIDSQAPKPLKELSSTTRLARRQIRRRSEGKGFITDSTSTLVVMRPARYRQQRVFERRSLKFEFAMYAMDYYAARSPEIPELAGMGRFLERLNELYRLSAAPRPS